MKVKAMIFSLTMLISCGGEVEETYWINYVDSNGDNLTIYKDGKIRFDKNSKTEISKLTEKENIFYEKATAKDNLERYRSLSSGNSLTDTDVVLIDIEDNNNATFDEYHLSKSSGDNLEKDFVLSFDELSKSHFN